MKTYQNLVKKESVKMTDFQTWLLDYGYDRLFRAWFYYPLEDYTNDRYEHIFIKEAIEMPDKDILLGVQIISEVEDIDTERPEIEYHKLSNMFLTYNPDDIKEYQEKNEE